MGAAWVSPAGRVVTGLPSCRRRFLLRGLEPVRPVNVMFISFRGALTAALAEDVDALAGLRGDQVAHVFDQAEHGNADLREHVDGFTGVL